MSPDADRYIAPAAFLLLFSVYVVVISRSRTGYVLVAVSALMIWFALTHPPSMPIGAAPPDARPENPHENVHT